MELHPAPASANRGAGSETLGAANFAWLPGRLPRMVAGRAAVRVKTPPSVAPLGASMRASIPSAKSGDPPARRLSIVFVGAFQEAAKDGAVGGSLFAARSLVASPLAEHVRWLLVDSTSRSVPPPGIPVRAFFAARRMVKFAVLVGRPDTDATLIFAGADLGFVEKGVMALMSKAAGKPVLFSPRSGLMIDAVARSRAQRWFVRAVLSRCDRVVCQGESWRSFYQDLTGLPGERLVTIPNWIDLKEYAGIRPARRAEGPPVFLYLGWIETYKGALDLVHAVGRARVELAGARVIVCGRGSALPEARRLTEELGLQEIIDFRGWVLGEQKRAVLAESDVLVLPSHLEGLPNALLEAMATGLPVIATRVGAIPDVVEDGKCGLLIEPGDVEALGRSMSRLAGDPGERERMGAAAREKIARDHDIEIAWPRMLAAMRAVVDDRRREGGL